MHEAQLHDQNSFVTLTYADEHLPPGGSLRKADFQKFMKRLRRRCSSDRIRFFHCGEYGARLARPHYHALLFGHAFPDRVPWSVRNEHPVWRSDSLEALWPFGQSEIGSVSFSSAAYVARYVTKKVTGRAAEAHYQSVDRSTGEVVDREPEYATMSRRPGIGHGWLERYFGDVYPSDEVVSRGRAAKPPRYYDNVLSVRDPELWASIKRDRAKARSREDETPARLSVREQCAASRARSFTRRLEEC